MASIKKYGALAGWIALSLSAGVFGSQFEPGIWYDTIAKPFFTPPDIVFPIVWPLLYIMMGTATWLLWKSYYNRQISLEIRLFLLQLVLNALWSYLFFGLHWVGTALFEILILLALLMLLTSKYWHKNKLAGILMFPYALWVAFASLLNGAIYWLN